MQIEIRNLRGLARASITVSPIALLAGLNKAGKSSACQGIGAVLARSPVFLPGVSKKAAGALVKAGAEEASVVIVDGDHSGNLSLPRAEVVADPALVASVYAVGLRSVVDLEDDKRANVLAPYLAAVPSKDDLEAAFKDANIENKVMEAVWTVITETGWDAAFKRAKDAGVKIKNRWEETTGGTWGAVKGASWKPEGWREDLEDKTPAELEQAVVNARTAVEQAIANTAVGEAELDRLRTIAADLGQAEADEKEAEDTRLVTIDLLNKATRRREAMPAVNEMGTHPEVTCPHCQVASSLIVGRAPGGVRYELSAKALPMAPDDLAKHRQGIAAADGEISRLTGEETDLRKKRDAAQARVKAAKAAQQQVATAVGSAGQAVDVDGARQKLSDAMADFGMVTSRQKARADHVSIMANQAMQAALAPEGLRQQAMARALEAFNKDHLWPLAQAAQWAPVSLEGDLRLTLGGRAYDLLSESEKFRARVVLQVAMARLDKSVLVVIDGADILDAPGRNGLFGLLIHAKVRAVVALTLSSPSVAPDLTKAGLGATFWINNGVAVPLAEAQAQKAA